MKRGVNSNRHLHYAAPSARLELQRARCSIPRTAEGPKVRADERPDDDLPVYAFGRPLPRINTANQLLAPTSAQNGGHPPSTSTMYSPLSGTAYSPLIFNKPDSVTPTPMSAPDASSRATSRTNSHQNLRTSPIAVRDIPLPPADDRPLTPLVNLNSPGVQRTTSYFNGPQSATVSSSTLRSAASPRNLPRVPSNVRRAQGSDSDVSSVRRLAASNASSTSLGAVKDVSAATPPSTSPPAPAPTPTPPKPAKATSSDPQPRVRNVPHLPHVKDIALAPASVMYWSKAPVWGVMPTHSMRAHSVTLVDNIAWLFGGCDDRGCWKDVWCFNTGALSSLSWSETVAACVEDCPRACSTCPSAVYPRLLPTNSTHVFSYVETMQWTRPDMQGDLPPPCRAHTATLVDRKLVIFGGGEGPTYYNGIYILDLPFRRWSQPTVTGDVPPPRRAHTSVLYKNKIWIFGGGNGVQALNDVWTLDVSGSCEKLKWEQVNVSRKRPTPRGYHTANLIGNVMIIMGGSDGRDCFSDIWALDLDTCNWTQIRPDATHRRLSHASTQVGSYLFITGGHDGTEYLSDLLMFNLVSLQFETRATAGKPPPPRGYHVSLLADSRLFIFGGFSGHDVFDDVHILDLAAAAYLPQVTSFRIET
ncbi:hypothetical protein OF83DRAFT_675176 [Amylostereum chailletii]|nr:hypothetical protein OF83DRAFT_675176 [Amylostereum chailletii]